MRVLITGSTGFVGGAQGRFAARAGYTVMGTGRSAKPGKDWPGLYSRSDASAESISEIVDSFSPDILFHAAGTASVGDSLANPLADFAGSVVIWANTLEGIRRSGKRPLVFMPSSAAVYGNPGALPVSEDAATKPISPYGVHKAMCETLARESAEGFGFRIVVCRLFSVFGPGQRRLLIWELFKQLIGSGRVAWLDGTGSESRDFLPVDDVAEAVFQLAKKCLDAPECYFEIVNLASGEEAKIVDVANQVCDIVAPGKEIACRGVARPGDPVNWRADISKLRSMIPAWQPRSLNNALSDCLALWQQESIAPQHGA